MNAYKSLRGLRHRADDQPRTAFGPSKSFCLFESYDRCVGGCALDVGPPPE